MVLINNSGARAVKEIEEFLNNEEASLKERQSKRINDNKDFEDLISFSPHYVIIL